MSRDPATRIAQLETQITKLQRELITDELTGIYNRRGLMKMLEVLHNEVSFQLSNPNKRNNFVIRNLSIIFIDLDHFRHINTEFGHAGGDLALRTVARTIQSRVR